MPKLLHYFVLIRLRKLFRKADVSVYLTVVAVFLLGSYILLQNIEKYGNYFLLFSLEILAYHRRRKDLELLKFRQNYRSILYAEYSIYSLPYTIPFLISSSWILFLAYQLLIYIYLCLPTYKFYVFKYPFKLFDPFWVICFRKNKLIWSLIPVLFLIYMGSNYDNDNLILFSFLILAIVFCIPSFQREAVYFIKVSKHKNYLLQQIKTNIYNSFFLVIPTAIFTLILGEYQLLQFIPLALLPMILNILTKYALFKKIFEHQILFAILLGGFLYFLPIIAIPFLLYQSKKNLKTIDE